MRSMKSFGASALRWASDNDGTPSSTVKFAVTVGMPEDDACPKLRDPQVQTIVAKVIDDHVLGDVLIAHSMGGLMPRTTL